MEEFRRVLFKPPPGVSDDYMRSLPEWTSEGQGGAFMAALAARGPR